MTDRPERSQKDYYLASWIEMLGALLGWPEARVRAWAARYDDVLDDPDDIFYHESPLYWAVSLLIPEPLAQRLAPEEYVDLRQQLLLAFADPQRYAFPLGTDWAPYRQRVEQLLREYEAD